MVEVAEIRRSAVPGAFEFETSCAIRQVDDVLGGQSVNAIQAELAQRGLNCCPQGAEPLLERTTGLVQCSRVDTGVDGFFYEIRHALLDHVAEFHIHPALLRRLDASECFLGEFRFHRAVVIRGPTLDLHGEAVQVFLTDQTLHAKVHTHFVQEHREFFSFGDVVGDHVDLATLNERLGVAVDGRLKVLR